MFVEGSLGSSRNGQEALKWETLLRETFQWPQIISPEKTHLGMQETKPTTCNPAQIASSNI
jgi:hypothetical protein